MADPLFPLQEVEQTGQDFVEDSRLSYFIPLATDLQLDDILKKSTESAHDALFDSIERRESLFFDESVNVFLILKTPAVSESDLRSSLKRLLLSIETSVTSNIPPTHRDQPTPSEVIFATHVDETHEFVILPPRETVEEEDEDEDEEDEETRNEFMHVVWKLPVFLNRPRIRLQSPQAVFSATASVKPTDASLPDTLNNGYMPSGVPSGLNLLETFGADPALNGIKPHLSALRVSRVAPVTQQAKDLLQPIKSLPSLSLKIFPAMHSRVRFSRPHTTPVRAAMMAMLDVDFTPFFECEIMLESISLSVEDGVVEILTTQPGMALPLSCVAHDHVTFLYRVAPADEDTVTKYPTRDLNISVQAKALVEPGVCQPVIQMAWTSALDFTLPLNPGYGPATQSIRRSHRPSQLSIGGNISLIAPSVSQPDALPGSPAPDVSGTGASGTSQVNVAELGLTITFTTPDPTKKIYAGDEFVWNAFVVNRPSASANPSPRKLALVCIPRRRRNESRVNRPPSLSRPSDMTRPKTPRDRSVADAVFDENVVHAMQRSSLVDSPDVVCLSADVRVGPLAPGACHVAELRFLALKEGIIGVDAIRVIDLSNNEHLDIRDLPTIVVEKRENE